jgi:hypothetical protein
LGYIYTLSLIIWIIVAYILVKIFGVNYITKDTNTILIILELVGYFWLYGIIIYTVNTFVIKKIPFPLDGYFGHNHEVFIEDISCWLFDYIILYSIFSIGIQSRIVFIYNKLTGSSIEYSEIFKRVTTILKNGINTNQKNESVKIQYIT